MNVKVKTDIIAHTECGRFQHELPVLNIVNTKRTIKEKQGRAMKEAENALWGERKTIGWSGVSHFAFAFHSSGQYWGEMVSRVDSTGGRWPVEWAVLGGDGQWSGQYWGQMVSGAADWSREDSLRPSAAAFA